MSPQQIVAVVARLLAIWIAIHLPGVVYSIAFRSGSDIDPVTRAFAVVGLAMQILVSLAIWFFPLTVARRLLRSSSEARPSPASADVWLGMGCGLIGLWLLATSLPALVIDAFVLAAETSGLGEVSSTLRHNVAYQLAEVVIALWLILGARGFREVFWWARNAGLGRSAE